MRQQLRHRARTECASESFNLLYNRNRHLLISSKLVVVSVYCTHCRLTSKDPFRIYTILKMVSPLLLLDSQAWFSNRLCVVSPWFSKYVFLTLCYVCYQKSLALRHRIFILVLALRQNRIHTKSYHFWSRIVEWTSPCVYPRSLASMRYVWKNVQTGLAENKNMHKCKNGKVLVFYRAYTKY